MVVVRPRPTRGWCLKDTKARGVSAGSCGDRPAENGMSTVSNEDEEMPPPQGVYGRILWGQAQLETE